MGDWCRVTNFVTAFASYKTLSSLVRSLLQICSKKEVFCDKGEMGPKEGGIHSSRRRRHGRGHTSPQHRSGSARPCAGIAFAEISDLANCGKRSGKYREDDRPANDTRPASRGGGGEDWIVFTKRQGTERARGMLSKSCVMSAT